MAAVNRHSEGQPGRNDNAHRYGNGAPDGTHDRHNGYVKRSGQHQTSIRRIRVTEALVRNALETGAA